jgi:hypothetical protein
VELDCSTLFRCVQVFWCAPRSPGVRQSAYPAIKVIKGERQGTREGGTTTVVHGIGQSEFKRWTRHVPLRALECGYHIAKRGKCQIVVAGGIPQRPCRVHECVAAHTSGCPGGQRVAAHRLPIACRSTRSPHCATAAAVPLHPSRHPRYRAPISHGRTSRPHHSVPHALLVLQDHTAITNDLRKALASCTKR